MPRESPTERYRRLAIQRVESKIDSIETLIATLLGGPVLPTQREFMFDPVEEQGAIGRVTRVKGYMGPLGCAKTATLCAAAILRALLIPGSCILIARLTYAELETTTQKRLMEQLSRLPPGVIIDYNKSAPATITLAPLVQGSNEPSTIICHSLDDPQKLASVEFTDAYVDEAREIPSSTVHLIETRCGRRGKGPFFLGMAFNPTSDAHWLYKESHNGDAKKPPYIKLYRPKPDENVINLPPGYYDSLAQTMSPEMKRRLIEGEWGSDFAGQAVYPEFSESLHVDGSLEYRPEEPTFRFWDFGYNNPCCLVAQKDHRGRIKVLHQFDGQREEIEPFLAHVRAGMAGLGLKEPDIDNGGGDYGDPSAYQNRDVGQTSQRLATKGVYLLAVPSRIDDGLALVRFALSRIVDSRPMLLVHPRCERLIQALRGGYRYKEYTEAQLPKLKPWKDDYYDHCADALRYGIFNLNMGDLRQMSQQTSVMPNDLGQDYGPSDDNADYWKAAEAP